MLNSLLSLSKINKKIIMIFTDSIILIVVLFVSFYIRFEEIYFPNPLLVWFIYLSPVIAIPIFYFFDLYSEIIRYIDFKSLWRLVNAVSIYALLWAVIVYMVLLDDIPRSIIFLNWFLSAFSLAIVRIVARAIITGDFKIYMMKSDVEKNVKRSLIYGAGQAGIQLMSALDHANDSEIIGFIDDSIALQGRQINGLSIISFNDINKLIQNSSVDRILIAMPSASRGKRLAIINKLEPFPIEVQILPGVSELLNGKVNISDLRTVDINDLLGRESVKPIKRLLSANITNKAVLVTGAGGSIGSELCRQIIILKPKILVLFEINELALYTIENELKSHFSFNNIFPLLGTVRDFSRLCVVFNEFKINTIYHAAAYKHVPMVEMNSIEGVNNNLFGTLNCAKAAINSLVDTFVLISSDKAVRPTNTMGASKRAAELVLQAFSHSQMNTKFTVVRFGNVLGSSGSVIPLFQEQIKNGGPVTVTDKKIIRYFMTVTEAVELVIQSGSMTKGGEVFVLEMGKPILIDNLAKKIIRLSGFEVKDKQNPDGDIEISYTGLRPGEKMFEELLIGNDAQPTQHSRIMMAKEEMIVWNDLEPLLDQIKASIQENNPQQLRSLLIKLVPDFKPKNPISDSAFKLSSNPIS